MTPAEMLTWAEENVEQARSATLGSFRSFLNLFYAATTGSLFQFQPFHHVVADKFQGIVDGTAKKQNLMISMPPRYGKSTMSCMFTAWGLAREPRSNFIETSYGQTLVADLSRQTRAIVAHPMFELLYGVTVAQDSSSKELWRTNFGGGFRAAVLSGSIVGFGAGRLEPGFGGAAIVDDYLKPSDYSSFAEKKASYEFYKNNVATRLNSPKTPIVMIAQRSALDDLAGRLLEEEPELWDVVRVEALKDGQSTWPERISTDTLLRMKRAELFKFMSQYQQDPYALGGNVVKAEWFRFYRSHDKPRYRMLFMTADTAMKASALNDHSAIGMWGLRGDNMGIDLLDMVHARLEVPQVESALLSLLNKWSSFERRPSAIYIEDKASGTGLIQSIRPKVRQAVRPLKATIDKNGRFMEALPLLASGKVGLPDSAIHPISSAVLGEFMRYDPTGRGADDIVDMVVHALNAGILRR